MFEPASSSQERVGKVDLERRGGLAIRFGVITLARVVDHADRRGYDSDLTDAQWALVEPLLPPERGGRAFGRPRNHPRREIVNAMLYMARAGCSWRQLPVTSRRGRRCTTTSPRGLPMAPCTASMIDCGRRCGTTQVGTRWLPVGG